jgi:hypothetical protein
MKKNREEARLSLSKVGTLPNFFALYLKSFLLKKRLGRYSTKRVK